MSSTPALQPARIHKLHAHRSPGRWWVLLMLLFAFGHASGQEESPATGEAPRFDVLEYVVTGNTTLATEIIERVLYPFLGPAKTVADVEAARAALEASYREAGYGTVLVDIPEQKVAGGMVTLQVVEGRVTRLRVVGSRYFSQGRIVEKVPSLAEGEVPNFKTASTELGDVNRTSDRRVTPLLRPGKEPGTTEVDLTVEDKLPLHGSLELNNKYALNTTRTRLQASLRYDNLWQRDHSLGFLAQVSPEDTSEVRVFSLAYTVPMGNGLALFSLIRSDSSTVAGIGDTQVFGKGSIYSLRRVFIDAEEKRSQSLILGADYKDFDELTQTGEVGFTTPVRYVPFSLTYTTSGLQARRSWQTSTGITFALRDVGSDSEEFTNKRFQGQTNFSIFKFDLQGEQQLDHSLSLSGRIEGQVSSQPLISNEQFVAGGVDSVRGYLEAAAVGDNGVRVSIELRSPNLAGKQTDDKDKGDASPAETDLRAHLFFEGAGLWIKSPLEGQDPRAGLLSTGFGLRLRTSRDLSLSLDVGWPLRSQSQTEKGSPRLHASGAVQF